MTAGVSRKTSERHDIASIDPQIWKQVEVLLPELERQIMNLDLQAKEWTKQAMCAGNPDPDMWHYESSVFNDERELSEWRTAEAKRICRDCPVKAECLAEGMKQENMLIFDATEGTIWGGLMLGERLKLRAGRLTYKGRKELQFLRNVNKKIAILDK